MTPDPFDLLFTDGDATPTQREAWRRAVAADPDLAAAAAAYAHVAGALRIRLDQAVPDRSVLVLYALDVWNGEVLTEAERQALGDARARLDNALERYPGLADVVADIRQAAWDFEAVWAAAHQAPAGAAPSQQRADRSPRPSRARWPWRIGVGLALVAFVALAVLLLQREVGQETITTAAGEVRTLTLEDGTRIRLMEGSTLHVSPASPVLGREVHLDGAAFFDVPPRETSFRVLTPTAVTAVLGTRFGVEGSVDETDVVLVQGRVTLAPRDAAQQLVVLMPGQRSRVQAGARPTAPDTVDVIDALWWTQQFVFQATPLREATRYLAAHHAVTIVVDEELAAEPVTGTFEDDRAVEEVVRVLAAAVGAEVVVGADGAYRIRAL